MKYYYKDALRIAAEAAFVSEVLETGMKDLTIGKDMDFATQEEWITARMTEWLEEAELFRKHRNRKR